MDRFLQGLIIGFSIAVPVGPIGILCIRRTLNNGRLSGFISGLGAASADAIYGGIAGFGLTLISNLLIGQQLWLRLVGGLFLLQLGLRSMPVPGAAPAEQPPRGTLWRDYSSTLLLTLTNPLTILSFAAVFAALGTANLAAGSPGWLVLGVFGGSAAWWLLLSAGVGLLTRRMTPAILGWINRISGGAIALFGLLALLSGFR